MWVETINAWSRWMLAADLADSTIRLRRYQLMRFAERFLDRSPWSLKAGEIVDWFGAQPWRANTRKSMRAALRSFYRWGCDTGQISIDPTARLPRVRPGRRVPRPAPETVLDTALADASDQLRIALLLLGYTGMRRAECARLNRSHIRDGVAIVRGKGDKERIIPLHETIQAELDAEWARRDAGGIGTGFRYPTAAAHGWLFPGRYGDGPMTPEALGKMVGRALGSGWSAHTIRHRFATQLSEAGVDLAVIQDLLGHESPETTRIYTLVRPARLQAAVGQLA